MSVSGSSFYKWVKVKLTVTPSWGTAEGYTNSSYYYSVSVSAYDYPSSITFDIIEAEGDDPFSRTLTFNEAGGYYTGARLGDVRGSAHWTFSKQS